MSLSTLTRYLRLRIATDLNQPASQNLARLDALGFTFGVGETDDLEVRSRGNIVLKPEASLVGGAGTGGEVHIGSSSQPVAVKFFASSFQVSGGAGDLVTESSVTTLTNKSISGNNNLISNIAYPSLNLVGSIVNADIATNAAIADSKLATISTAGKVNVSALTGSLSGSLLPSYSGNGEKYLRLNSDGDGLEWAPVAAGGVTSVNGQTGEVSLSIPAEYTDTDADARVTAGINAVRGQADGLASLDSNGKLPTSQLPSLAIADTNVVSSQAEMLALTAERGDVAIRTDNGKTYILATDEPATIADWKEVVAAGAVTSVNGQTGNVSLSSSNITEGSNLYYTAARVQSEVDSRVAKTTWSGGNSKTLNTGWGTQDVHFSIFDSDTKEPIIPHSISWDGSNNNVTFALPTGQVAGTWRVIAFKM